MCRGRVSPGLCDRASAPSKSGGGPSFARSPTFLGRETKTVPIGEQSACPVRCHSAWSRIRAAVSVLIVLRQPDRRPPAIRTGYKSRRAQDRFPTWKNNGYASVVQKRGGVIPTGTATNHGCDIDQVNSVPSNQPSRPLRSELTSKPAGLHLNDRLRLSHDRGPSKRSDTGIKECRSTPKGVGRYPPGGTGDASREAVDQMVVPKAA